MQTMKRMKNEEITFQPAICTQLYYEAMRYEQQNNAKKMYKNSIDLK